METGSVPQRTDSGSVAHGSSILSEVDNTSISGRGSQTRQRCPLNWLPASRLLPPRSGLERSDFVRWHDLDLPEVSAFAPLSVAQRTSKVLRRHPYIWVHALTDQHPHFMSATDQRADEPDQQEDVGDAIGWIRPRAMLTDLLSCSGLACEPSDNRWWISNLRISAGASVNHPSTR